jgi:protein SCO1/2
MIALALSGAARGAHASEIEAQQRADLRERLGARLDPGLQFRDHTGARVSLGQLLNGGMPVLLTLNYFHCPMLCDLQLERLGVELRHLARDGRLSFRALTVSIDPHDTAQDALAKRARLVRETRATFDWRFLIGAADQVRALARGLGASFAYDSSTGLRHRVLRLALLDASAGRVGSSADRILLRCFQYDAASGRYSLYVLGAVQASSGALLLAMAIAMVSAWRREQRRGALR